MDNRRTLRTTGTTFAVLFVAALAAGSARPALLAAGSFADPAFERVWTRSDQLVADGQANRSWYWGPQPNTGGLMEDYANAPGGQRLVQYFDKSRMEINDPNGDRSSGFFVTNGLLTDELISGSMQVGDAATLPRGPSCSNVSGDADDPNAPTYNSFRSVASVAPGVGRRDPNKRGLAATETINRSGATSSDPSKASVPGVTYVYYEPATQHNIPQVFWTFLNQQGPVIESGQQVVRPLNDPWFYASGYPVSDAFWARVKVAGQYQDVLIQAYERRVLTYNPANPPAFQMEMGNIGQHYYDWRYKNATCGPSTSATPAPKAPTNTPTPRPQATATPLPPTATPRTNQPPGVGVPVQLAPGVTMTLRERAADQTTGTYPFSCDRFMVWVFTFDNTTGRPFALTLDPGALTQTDNKGTTYDQSNNCLGPDKGAGGVFEDQQPPNGVRSVPAATNQAGWLKVDLTKNALPPDRVYFDLSVTINGKRLQFRHAVPTDMYTPCGDLCGP